MLACLLVFQFRASSLVITQLDISQENNDVLCDIDDSSLQLLEWFFLVPSHLQAAPFFDARYTSFQTLDNDVTLYGKILILMVLPVSVAVAKHQCLHLYHLSLLFQITFQLQYSIESHYPYSPVISHQSEPDLTQHNHHKIA